MKGSQNNESYPEKEKTGTLILLDFKTYYKASG